MDIERGRRSNLIEKCGEGAQQGHIAVDILPQGFGSSGPCTLATVVIASSSQHDKFNGEDSLLIEMPINRRPIKAPPSNPQYQSQAILCKSQ